MQQAKIEHHLIRGLHVCHGFQNQNYLGKGKQVASECNSDQIFFFFEKYIISSNNMDKTITDHFLQFRSKRKLRPTNNLWEDLKMTKEITTFTNIIIYRFSFQSSLK